MAQLEDDRMGGGKPVWLHVLGHHPSPSPSRPPPLTSRHSSRLGWKASGEMQPKLPPPPYLKAFQQVGFGFTRSAKAPRKASGEMQPKVAPSRIVMRLSATHSICMICMGAAGEGGP